MPQINLLMSKNPALPLVRNSFSNGERLGAGGTRKSLP
jgi:hypothetical protein